MTLRPRCGHGSARFLRGFPLRLRHNSVASTQHPRIGHGHVSHGYVVTWVVAYSLHIVLRLRYDHQVDRQPKR